MRCNNSRIVCRNLSMVVLLFFIMMTLFSCKKYLDKKSRQDLAIPSSLSDLQAVLNNSQMNGGSPAYLEFVADNFYLTTSAWNGSPIEDRTNYIWDKNAITPDFATWNDSYSVIYNTNFVLDLLPKIAFDKSEQSLYNDVNGTAHFWRAFMFHQLAQLFCNPFSNSADTDPGIVLRLTSEIETPSKRSTVKETYDQIIADLKVATLNLPIISPTTMRPNKAAAYGELARVYLSIRDYTNAGLYADSCLKLYNTLLDYNTITSLPGFVNNPEILLLSYEGQIPSAMRNSSNCNIDTTLYKLYGTGDLRRSIFFGTNGSSRYWIGSYANNYGSFTVFDGIAVDEVYLIRAECYARDGKKDQAMADLNVLLRKRWNGTFTDLSATDNTDALNKVLVERRKELLFRGLRWSDLRRFNLENANIALTRHVNNTTYTLPPGDFRWVLLIPNVEVSRSGIPQNSR